MMPASRRTIVAPLASVLLIAISGCASLTERSEKGGALLDSLPWASKKKDAPPEPYPNPVKLAATWSPDVLVQMGRTPTRGFGGRLYFYDEKSRPVPVEGSLTVHGFDEKATDPQAGVKRFKFTPEQLTKHFGQSDIGASYSIWIPWDAAGGDQREISLVASFKTAEGKLVQGTPAKVLLPGRKPSAQAKLQRKMSPQFRRWKQASSGSSPANSGLTTTTIRRHPRVAPQAPAEWPARDRGGVQVAGGGHTPAADVSSSESIQPADFLPDPSLAPDPAAAPAFGPGVVPASARLPIGE